MPELTIQKTKIYYELHGKEGKPYLILIHGLGSSVRDWEFQIPVFSEDYRVLAIDMRGHGRSDKPKEKYSVRQFGSDVIAVMDALKIEKAHIVGISMGGMIAFQMAVDCPERIEKLVIVNSGPALVPKTLAEKIAIYSRFVIVRLMGMRKMGEVLAPKLFVDAEQENLRQTFAQRWAENDPNAYLNTLRALVGWDVEAHIHKIQQPSLILCSDQDYSPLALKEAYLAKMPSATLQVIPNAHHAVSSERPEAFNEAVLAWLKTV
jgi:3-oxoadipate enol-lactonase